MSQTFADQLSRLLNEALHETASAADIPSNFVAQIDQAQNRQFGDYQSNVAMILAKQVKKTPSDLAAEIIEAIPESNLIETPEIAGPGFINFRITETALDTRLTELLADDTRLGVAKAKSPQTIVADFSAPNVAKPMHVGHIRSTIIGDSLTRIGRFLGHKVISDNHIGDWGTQFGMILWGWKNLLDEAAMEENPIEELLRIYRDVNAKTKDDEALKETCKNELVKLQGGDEENLQIWERCIELSKTGLQKIYNRLDVNFDHWLGESFYNDQLGPLVEQLLESGIAEESDGAVAVFSDGSLPEKEDPLLKNEDDEWKPQPALIRKSDGGFLYATTDLATIDYRIEKLGADAIWYIVGAPQQLHFDQIFQVAKRRGQDADLQFIPFGSILGKDRKMLRTRSGDTVQLADVLDEAVERARKIVEEKNPDFSNEEKTEIAEIIGIGSVKYAELSQFRMTDYIFDWDTMLALKGNTAPYLLNAYVRTRAIFRKLGNDYVPASEISLTEDAERTLTLRLAQFAEIVPTVLDDFRPNALAQYLYDVATTYHKFWEACPVLKAEGAVRNTRLALCELTGRILRCGLGLLGIRTTEKM
ncbi:arginine--tRNA ligase [Verrucomicrobiales bacterium]|nr:arginine--tRNA ligase [Verrucomicrobiales bacterium]MDA9924760.1 arginine--tRNA ligase [Verrucomicrobiales bacterium]